MTIGPGQEAHTFSESAPSTAFGVFDGSSTTSILSSTRGNQDETHQPVGPRDVMTAESSKKHITKYSVPIDSSRHPRGFIHLRLLVLDFVLAHGLTRAGMVTMISSRHSRLCGASTANQIDPCPGAYMSGVNTMHHAMLFAPIDDAARAVHVLHQEKRMVQINLRTAHPTTSLVCQRMVRKALHFSLSKPSHFLPSLFFVMLRLPFIHCELCRPLFLIHKSLSLDFTSCFSPPTNSCLSFVNIGPLTNDGLEQPNTTFDPSASPTFSPHFPSPWRRCNLQPTTPTLALTAWPTTPKNNA
ncbi:hypothetical protein IWX47DRAFT_67485 [Phyllosticta citricarpa]